MITLYIGYYTKLHHIYTQLYPTIPNYSLLYPTYTAKKIFDF